VNPFFQRQDAKTPRRKVSASLSWRLRAFALKSLNAIREDRKPNLLLMRYALATGEVRDRLLIPSFVFSERHFFNARTPRRQDAKFQQAFPGAFAPFSCAFGENAAKQVRFGYRVKTP
jgi:hypothetical protein